MLRPPLSPSTVQSLFWLAKKTTNVPATLKVYIVYINLQHLQHLCSALGMAQWCCNVQKFDIFRHWWWEWEGKALHGHRNDLVFDLLFDRVDLHFSIDAFGSMISISSNLVHQLAGIQPLSLSASYFMAIRQDVASSKTTSSELKHPSDGTSCKLTQNTRVSWF